MKRIALIGPECTGKSSLSKALSDYFESPWIPEYARTYVENLNRPYTFDDVEAIARHQVKELSDCQNKFADKPYVFLDTDLIITKVWFQHAYNRIPDWLNEAIIRSDINHYFLCFPDLPWISDPLRENGHLRNFFFDWYQREVADLNKPFSVIKGEGDSRLHSAIKILENIS
jgi:nicotinamide riboside kinase